MKKPILHPLAYGGWPNCLRLSDGRTEAIVTTDVGPRIIRYGFAGGPNLLKEFPKELGRRGGRRWRIYGGHRLWLAPEDTVRTYVPDNDSVPWTWNGRVLTLRQPPDAITHIAKEIRMSYAKGGALRVHHRLVNHGRAPAQLAPWSLTVMAPRGVAVFPQEPYRSHTEEKLPARPVVLWPYTDMSDPRWTWGRGLLLLRQDPRRPQPQKVGFYSTRGWMAYLLRGQAFIKCHDCARGAVYPDFGCNVETFTDDEILELETLGPLIRLAPRSHVDHVETWGLFKMAGNPSEETLSRAAAGLIRG
jgi:hypothetical protein